MRLWAVSALTLVAATWRLWTPLRTPPRLPAFDFLVGFPPGIDFALLAGLVIGSIASLHSPSRRSTGLTTLCLAGLMLLDQLRWQPWAYQLLLVGLAVSRLSWPGARAWLRALLVSVYLYAAAAKLDTVFAHTLGQQIVDSLAAMVGLDASNWPGGLRLAFALMLPLGEGAVGLLLAWPRGRRVGVVAAATLHGGILLALGPLGLGHRLGVLLWNVFSIGFAALLFWPSETDATQDEANQDEADEEHDKAQNSYLAKAIFLAAIAGPLLHPLGYWDRWPAWGLYAPRGERAELWVHERVIDRLPAELSTQKLDEEPSWRKVEIDEWVLDQTGSPRYPQNRVAAGLAKAIEERFQLDAYLRLHLDGRAGRLDSSRQRLTLNGAEAIKQYAEESYWLSTRSRWSR